MAVILVWGKARGGGGGGVLSNLGFVLVEVIKPLIHSPIFFVYISISGGVCIILVLVFLVDEPGQGFDPRPHSRPLPCSSTITLCSPTGTFCFCNRYFLFVRRRFSCTSRYFSLVGRYVLLIPDQNNPLKTNINLRDSFNFTPPPPFYRATSIKKNLDVIVVPLVYLAFDAAFLPRFCVRCHLSATKPYNGVLGDCRYDLQRKPRGENFRGTLCRHLRRCCRMPREFEPTKSTILRIILNFRVPPSQQTLIK